ncbi:hypothetical protein BGW80DRAFT_1454278 [Lactifluus volemus]|nr:hypothetical protein BGW80DRAFT_1454278 [Lactifluus volemus]
MAMAAAIAKSAVISPPSPSPFATLLRRSKFASYDPTIGQVYTTHHGNAHRGNWGFKRPLALRKRDKFISVQAIDSREQQTEWTPRESEARFIRRWEEVATEPSVRDAWERHYMNSRPIHDAELAKETKAETSRIWPYGARLTSSRRSDKRSEPSAYEESARGSAETVRRRFLQRQSHTIYDGPHSRAIEQRPHRNGGLSYAYTSQLTHFFTTHDQPGRFVDSTGPDLRTVVRASFAGMAANLKVPIVNRDTVSKFRVVGAKLKQAPNIVSPRSEGLDGAAIDVTVQDVESFLYMTRDNPFPPGSRAYIAHAQTIIPPKGKRSVTVAKSITRREMVPEGEVTKVLLSTLKDIINGLPTGGDTKPQ